MKGYLKSPEGVFQLAPRITTVGRDGCDLSLRVGFMDTNNLYYIMVIWFITIF